MALRDTITVEFPGRRHGPLRNILVRITIAVTLVMFVALLTYAGRDGFVDAEGDAVSLLDAFYYATVSITTTGYGDDRPVSDQARLLTTMLALPQTPTDHRTRLRRHQIQPPHRPLPAPRALSRPLRMATDHRQRQPHEAPPPPTQTRRCLTAPGAGALAGGGPQDRRLARRRPPARDTFRNSLHG